MCRSREGGSKDEVALYEVVDLVHNNTGHGAKSFGDFAVEHVKRRIFTSVFACAHAQGGSRVQACASQSLINRVNY